MNEQRQWHAKQLLVVSGGKECNCVPRPPSVTFPFGIENEKLTLGHGCGMTLQEGRRAALR